MSFEHLFYIDRQSNTTIQEQLRAHIVSAILDGHIPKGIPLPSCRKLSKNLGISRNTVVLVYEMLISEGFLYAFERSGYYINEEYLTDKQNILLHKNTANKTKARPQWLERVEKTLNQQILKPHIDDWQSYKYPFIYGQIDPNLFPTDDWRKCSQQSHSLAAVQAWSGDQCMQDDPMLINQIRTRLLPRFGVHVSGEEILITLGTQNALYLIANLLVKKDTPVGLENPGYLDAYNIFRRRSDQIVSLDVDHQGMICNEKISKSRVICVTPSHQYPTTVTMSLRRRIELLQIANKNNVVVVEDNYENEINHSHQPVPALKSLDNKNQVIFCSGLSKSLASGLRVGYMVGPPEFIEQCRALRRLIMRHPPANNQRTVALFLARGNYDSHAHKIRKTLENRWRIMYKAINEHLPYFEYLPNSGGTCFWLKGGADFDSHEFQQEAKKHSILFECGHVFFHGSNPPKNYFRLGFSSISKEKIEPGIKELAKIFSRYAGEPNV